MKNLVYILIFIMGLITVYSCNDEFLDISPEDKITDLNFWRNAEDVRLYANQFYEDLIVPKGYIWRLANNASDNLGPVTRDDYLWGESTVPASKGGWAKADWLAIQRVNYGLSKIDKMKNKDEEVLSYEGEIRFFKSYYYFDKVVEFGDVPWFDEYLNIDSDELFKGRDSRKDVIANIMKDLDFAIDHLPESSSSNRLTKYAALAFKTEVCLFEGTYRKSRNLGDFNELLVQAVKSAETIMNSGHFSVYSTGDPDNDYFDLFVQYDLTNNPEAIMFVQYIKDKLMQNEPRYLGETSSGYTKAFVESFLCTDGKPIGISNLYKGDKVYENEFINRDPRMRQNIHTAERKYRIYPDGAVDYKIPPIFDGNRCWTGYEMIKRYSPYEVDRLGGQCVIDQFIFRYSKVLLDYAEAKAELGECTQEVLDMSINLLRDRVAMPHLTVDVGFTDPNWPEWEVPVSPLINEIRRERRIEISIEGKERWRDIVRWKAGKLLEDRKTLLGAYDPEKGEYHELYPGFQRKWDDKLYLHPIPTVDLTLNPKLEQNPGWSD